MKHGSSPRRGGDSPPEASIHAANAAEDVALTARLAAGDERAFTQLVERLHGPMLRLARTIMGDPTSAQEIVQETWAAVIDGLPRFEGRSSLKTWILRILSNRAQTHATREKRMVPFAWLEDPGSDGEPAVEPERFSRWGRWSTPPTPWSARSPEDLALRKETGARLMRELEGLPPGQRAVVMLRDVEECTSEEVCSILGVSEANQRVLLHRGRSKMRAALERYLDNE